MRLWDMLKAKNGMPVGRAFPALWGASRQNTVATITGVPPLTFRSGGMALTDYTILGNSYQDGTPSPDMPVEVVGVGERTENLFNLSTITNGCYFHTNGQTVPNADWCVSDYIGVDTGIYTAVGIGKGISETYCCLYDSDKNFIGSVVNNMPVTTINVPANCAYVRLSLRKLLNEYLTAMFVKGTTVPSSYVPYGYKIPITCGGVTQNIYLDEPLRKQLNGDAADALNYATQTLTRRVDANCDPLQTPTTETVTLPAITTVNGANTLLIGTTLPPSAVSITGHIKPSSIYGNLTDVNGTYIKDKDGVQIKVTG